VLIGNNTASFGSRDPSLHSSPEVSVLLRGTRIAFKRGGFLVPALEEDAKMGCHGAGFAL